EVATGRCLFTFRALGEQLNRCSGAGFSQDGRSAYIWDRSGSAVEERSLEWEWVAPFQLCRARISEEALETQRRFQELLKQARQKVADEPAGAVPLLQRVRALPGCRRQRDVLDLWTGLYTRLPRSALQGGWEIGTFAGHQDRVCCVCVSA